ncbi:MAG: nucleotidyltransferase domain-containing protein [Sulfobacillus acidophilus]|uniref:Nucleotidyltransferase domain-containing protein n=1 Tax=Sulfobacillus acidophilus TaxID=53633 RepID=A0A2T2WG05_9FIRM|nr:MAG: nucleotidyltransferase domain-containing protein [Sulfobacillus acidophilus]
MSLIKNAVIRWATKTVPDILALYVFGSRAQGTCDSTSDWDFALLVPGYCQPLQLWEWSDQLADIVQAPVDLLDFRAASTVMQYEILTTGERWWAQGAVADLYECAVLSDKLDLDEQRAALLDDIEREGRIYAR